MNAPSPNLETSMSSSSTPEAAADSIFICDCEEHMRSACAGELFFKEHNGKRYCVLHYPDTEKSEDFEKALQRKLDDGDFDFQGVWFPKHVSFEKFTFSTDAHFSDAHFSANAYFSDAHFSANASF